MAMQWEPRLVAIIERVGADQVWPLRGVPQDVVGIASVVSRSCIHLCIRCNRVKCSDLKLIVDNQNVMVHL